MKIELSLEDVREIEAKLQRFVDKVESRKVRSKETYADLKEILALLKRKKEDLFERNIFKIKTPLYERKQ